MNIEGGLDFIARQQQKNGGFSSERLKTRQKDDAYQTTFVPSLIALSLQDVPGSKGINDGIAQFLLRQKSEGWSWNYWERESLWVKTLPYPDDLDDTFLALAALMRHDATLLTPAVMAEVAQLLFATESATGGPYRTWLVDEAADDAWRDIDVVANINIASFLSLHDVSLPNVDKLIETAIRKNQLTSPYYHPLLPAAYFLSRFYTGPSVEKLRSLIVNDQRLGIWECPHLTAQAVSGLLRLGHPAEDLEMAVGYITASQMDDGGWLAGPACVDTVRTGEAKRYFTGSAALTTAVCIEAALLYEQRRKKARLVTKKTKKQDNAAYNAVTNEVKTVINKLEQADLTRHTKTVFDTMLARDHDKQIVMLPYLVAKAMKCEVQEEVLHKLAIASLWGWMAYTVYDDFLDDEGDPKLLPSAIVAHRHLTYTLKSVLKDNDEFQTEVASIMNRLDGANAWEVSHCRGTFRKDRLFINELPEYGDYWQLADRSLGHTIAGIGVLYSAGFSSHSTQIVNLRTFFRHYLIARQLNDDAHDWEEDLMLGHINVVATMILKKWQDSSAGFVSDGIDLRKDIESLRLIMWEQVIDEVCTQVQLHAELARKALKQQDGNHVSELAVLLLPLEEATKKALETRDQALEFISSLSD